MLVTCPDSSGHFFSNGDRSGTHKTTVYVFDVILNEVGDGRARLAKKAGASVLTGKIPGSPRSSEAGWSPSVVPLGQQLEKDSKTEGRPAVLSS